MKKRRAFITGVTGQDGSYLAEYLAKRGYEVWGFMRYTSLNHLARIRHLVESKKITLLRGNLSDSHSLRLALEEVRPDEVYNLASLSDVAFSKSAPEETMDINYFGFKRLITEAVRVNKNVRIFQASTSEIFKKTRPPQSEKSPLAATNPYAVAKLKAYRNLVKGYRERRGYFIASGIMFNHESPRRGENFVTRKVTMSLARIKLGLLERFSLGNLDARRDWGFAGDYVKAMHLMLQQKKADDFVLATGKTHSIRDLVEAACRELDIPLEWRGQGLEEVGISNGKVVITIDKAFYRPTEADEMRGDITKARRVLKWKPEVSFEKLVGMIARADLELLEKSR